MKLNNISNPRYIVSSFKVFQLCHMMNNGQDVSCDIWEKA